jgi:hypothetical protein
VTATNSANVIQVEIVGFARESGNWPESYYQHLAGLALLIERYLKASDRKLSRKHRRFERPVKFDSRGFISFSGHCGHVHVPGNSHYDPGTGFRGRKLIHEMAKLEKQEKR